DARLKEQIAARVTKFGGDGRTFQEQGTRLHEFAEGVSAKLPPGYRELPGNPSVESMLERIGKMYSVYTFLAAYIHGGHASTWLYRQNLGTLKEFGEFLTPAPNGICPSGASWSSLHFLGQYMLERVSAKTPQFVSSEQCAAIDQALASLNSNATGITR